MSKVNFSSYVRILSSFSIRIVHLEVSAGGRQDQDGVSVNKLWKDPDRVVESSLVLDVSRGQVVPSNYLASVPDADPHVEVAKLGLFEPRHDLVQGCQCMHRLGPPFHLRQRQISNICGVSAKMQSKVAAILKNSFSPWQMAYMGMEIFSGKGLDPNFPQGEGMMFQPTEGLGGRF